MKLDKYIMFSDSSINRIFFVTKNQIAIKERFLCLISSNYFTFKILLNTFVKRSSNSFKNDIKIK